jgi:MerR family transcriptional regulator/heat shock protein HspR
MGTKGVKSEYTVEEVSQILKISGKELSQFEEEGVFEYLNSQKKKLDQNNFERLKSAVSLYRDLGVNIPGIDIILSMKDKMNHLQGEFNDLLVQVQKKMGNQIKKDMDEIRKNLK